MTQKGYFKNLWDSLKDYVADGYSVMPVRMEDDEYNGRKLPPKSPLFSFRSKSNKTKDLDYLFNIMNIQSVEVGFALCTGSLSKNLEVIDIDEKYNPGITKEYLSSIETTYPELYKKLRITGTINHGAHIPYHLNQIPEGSQDLAKRLPTDEEKTLNPKQKNYCFIETRGEGSLCVAPPTKGYTVIQDNRIPTLTNEERNILINVAKSFNRLPKKKIVSYSKRGLRNYHTDPWEDFNSDPQNQKLLLNYGWEIESENNHHIYFTRPGKKTGVSASFIKEHKTFFIFTSSSQLEPDKGYNPSSLLCELEFNGDTKETFKYLINNGYGKLNENFENELIKKAVINNRALPKNISKKAKEEYKTLKEDYSQKYPYGIFWQGDLDDGFSINRELIINVATGMNYSLLDDKLIQVEGKIIKEVSRRDFEDELKSYIKEEDENEFIAIQDRFEAFIQYTGKQTISRLPVFDKDKILKDSRYTAYKAYENGVVKITKNKIEIIDYDDLDLFVIEKEIQPRNFQKSDENGLFSEFLSKAILPNQNLKQHIGYLIHGYKDSANSYFHVATETVEDPKDGGGSGKNIFAHLIGSFTSFTEIPGEQIKMDESFYQSWTDEKVMVISDLPQHWNFSFVKNMVSNSALQKKLYQDVKRIQAKDLPKLLMLTNFSFEITDGGVKRRLMFIEFSDFFTKSGGVDVYFDDRLFPSDLGDGDWDEDDWIAYDNYMISCLQEYLKNPKLVNPQMSDSGWIKQFSINHGKMTRMFISENIDYWVQKQYVSKKEFDDDYRNFCNENGIQDRYKKSAMKMNEALEEWCNKYDIKFEKSVQRTINYVNVSCRAFITDKTNIDTSLNDSYDLPF